MTPVTFKLPDDVKCRLDDIAWARRISLSTLLREIIEKHLKEDEL